MCCVLIYFFLLIYIQFKYKVYKTECLQGHVEFRALYMKILWHYPFNQFV